MIELGNKKLWSGLGFQIEDPPSVSCLNTILRTEGILVASQVEKSTSLWTSTYFGHGIHSFVKVCHNQHDLLQLMLFYHRMGQRVDHSGPFNFSYVTAENGLF